MGALWAADPHEFGPGKVHIVDGDGADRDAKTMCGKWLKAMPGKISRSGRATCKICLNSVESRAHNEHMRAEWDRQREQHATELAAQQRERQAQYNAYLQSPEWRRRRTKVMKRANGICEACLEQPATQVHHLTYAHIFNEPCFDLRAVCRSCHDAITEMDTGKGLGT